MSERIVLPENMSPSERDLVEKLVKEVQYIARYAKPEIEEIQIDREENRIVIGGKQMFLNTMWFAKLRTAANKHGAIFIGCDYSKYSEKLLYVRYYFGFREGRG